jgi:hypothetical protein
MNDINESKLAELARKATQKWSSGVWIETDGNEWRATGPGHEEESHDCGSEPGSPDEQAAQRDAAFIAAASPDVVLALLQGLTSARASCETLSQHVVELTEECADWQRAVKAHEDSAERNARSLERLDEVLGKNEELRQALASAREDARRARLVASDAGMEEIAKLEAEVGAMRDAAVMLTEDLAKVTRERDEAIGLAEKALDLKWSRATRRPAKVTAIRERLATIRKEASE